MDCKTCKALKGRKPAVKANAPCEPTAADHARYIDLEHAWRSRDFNVDNFEVHLSLVQMCEKFGFEIPYDAR